MKKKLLMALSLVLTLGIGIGGTFAYLTSSATVENTFTVGSVKLTLDESKYDPNTNTLSTEKTDKNNYKVIPGMTAGKDPTLHLVNNTPAYLFVEIDNQLDTTVRGSATLNITAQWKATELEAKHGGTVYVYVGNGDTAVKATTGDFAIFTTVTYSQDLNERTIAALNGKQILTYGYAVQAEGFTSADVAWAAIS